MSRAKVIGIKRHCLGTDGDGITTLVAFHGCPLKCKYCLNPQCHISQNMCKKMEPWDIMKILRKDCLYFIATNGGVTFGGGEPLLQSKFIKDVILMGAIKWHITLETSLCVPNKHLKRLLPFIDEYIVDIKDMNDNIYKSYTGRSNTMMKENLQYLVTKGKADKVLCRIPLIPGYNTDSNRQMSEGELTKMGFTRFEKFTYFRSNSSSIMRNSGIRRLTLADVRSRKNENKPTAIKEQETCLREKETCLREKETCLRGDVHIEDWNLYSLQDFRI